MIATISLYFSFVLPVSDPHLMVAYGTDTFAVKDLMKIGIPLTVIALLLLVVSGSHTGIGWAFLSRVSRGAW